MTLLLTVVSWLYLQVRAESPMEHPAQGKRSDTLGPPVLEQLRPVRAKALSYGAVLEQIYMRYSTLRLHFAVK